MNLRDMAKKKTKLAYLIRTSRLFMDIQRANKVVSDSLRLVDFV